MSESKTVGVAIVEVIGSAIWPAVALIAALFFAPSVKTFLDSAAAQVKNATTIKFGSVELTVSKDGFPKPSKSVAEILPKLSTEEIDFILSQNSPVGPETFCSQASQDTNEIELVRHLKSIGLLTAVDEFKSPKNDCNDKLVISGFRITFDPLFTSTRNYYFDVIKKLKFTEN